MARDGAETALTRSVTWISTLALMPSLQAGGGSFRRMIASKIATELLSLVAIRAVEVRAWPPLEPLEQYESLAGDGQVFANAASE